MAVTSYEEFTEQNPGDTSVQVEWAATYSRLAMMEFSNRSAEWINSLATSLEILEGVTSRQLDASDWYSYTEGLYAVEEVGAKNVADPAQAAAVLNRGVQLFERLSGQYPEVYGLQHELAACHFLLGEVISMESAAEAVPHYETALETWEALIHTRGPKAAYASALSDVCQGLKMALQEVGHAEEGERVVRRGIHLLREQYGESQPELAELLRSSHATDPLKRLKDLSEAVSISDETLREPGLLPVSQPEVRWNQARAWRDLGEVFSQQLKFQDALREATKAKQVNAELLKQSPHNDVYRASLADDCRLLGNILSRNLRQHDDAIVQYSEAVRWRKEIYNRHSGEAGDLQKLCEVLTALEIAFRAANRATAADAIAAQFNLLFQEDRHGDPAVWVGVLERRYIALMNARDRPRAIAAMDQAIALSPQTASLYYRRGNAHRDLGSPELAIADFGRAIELNPDAACLRERALLLIEMGRQQEAANDFARMKDYEQNWYSRFCHALYCLSVHDVAGYSSICQHMSDRYEQESELMGRGATQWTCMLTPAGVDDTRSLIETALALQEVRRGYSERTIVGAAHYRSGNYDKAVSELVPLIDEWNPNSPQAAGALKPATLYYLAMACQRSGRVEDARKYLEQANAEAERDLRKKHRWRWHVSVQCEVLCSEATPIIEKFALAHP